MSAPISSISLRLCHPTLPHSDIVREIGMKAEFSHTVGQQRRTPKGRLLEGLYRETYCCFKIKKKGASHLDDDLRPWCDFLEKHAIFLQVFLETGGRLEFYISIFLDGDRGFELDGPMLQRISALGVGLSVEMYRLSDDEAANSGAPASVGTE